MKIIKRIMCKHDYVYTGKTAWYMTSGKQIVPCRIYKCSKCDHETKIDFHGQEVSIF